MPRRKTFRKRRQKLIQRGGAAPTIEGIGVVLPDFNDTPTKYYGMVRKTRKIDQDFDYKSHLVNQSQKDAICGNDTDKKKVMISDPEGPDSFTQFYQNDRADDLITFFELINAANTTLNDLKIDNVDDVNWTIFVGCA